MKRGSVLDAAETIITSPMWKGHMLEFQHTFWKHISKQRQPCQCCMQYIIPSAAPHDLPWVSDNITDQFETPKLSLKADNCDTVHESNVAFDYMGNMQ
jgi:hypothetical protein